MANNIQQIKNLQHGQCHRIENKSGEQYNEAEVWRIHDDLLLYEQQEGNNWLLLGGWNFTDTSELEAFIEWANG